MDDPELKRRFEEFLKGTDIFDLRISKDKSTDPMSWKVDIENFFRFLLFLYRSGQLPAIVHLPKRFIKAQIMQYTLPNPDLPNDIYDKYQEWRNILLDTIDQLSNESLLSLRSNDPKEFVLWYWRALDLHISDPASMVKIIKDKFGREGNRRIIVRPNVVNTSQTYDAYLQDLSSRIYQRNERFDVVLIDSNTIYDYQSKGAITSFEMLYQDSKGRSLSTSEGDMRQHFAIGKTKNGHLDALPATRNFHLPARGIHFFKAVPKELLNAEHKNWESLKVIYDGVCDFLGINNDESEAGNIPVSLGRDFNNLYDFFWPVAEEMVIEKFVEQVWKGSNPKPIAKVKDPFSCTVGCGEKTPFLTPFILSLGGCVPFIPMQLAAGAHAAYTFMAYTANLGDEPKQQSFISILSIDEANTNTGVVGIVTEGLPERLKVILRMMFNFVPDSALCFDHLLSAVIREDDTLKDFWFDPCLPIEAIMFQHHNPDIKVNTTPAKVAGERFLTCFGGFCFGISTDSQRPADAAVAAWDFVYEQSSRATSELKRTREKKARDGTNTAILNKYDRMIPLAELRALITKHGEAAGDAEETDFCMIESPKYGAVRPNFELWPALESEIASTFRIYSAALFVYRAIHFEIAALNQTTIHDFLTTNLGEDLQKKHKKHGEEDLLHWFIGENMTESFHSSPELLVMDVLKAYHIKQYLSNIAHCLSCHPKCSNDPLKEVIKNNIDPLITDADYLVGILRDCADKVEIDDDDRMELAHFKTGKGGGDVAKKMRKRHFEKVCDQMLDKLAASLTETIVTKAYSLCSSRGWKVHEIE